MKLKFKASVKNGKASLDKPHLYSEAIKKYEGKEIQITIDKWSSIRTHQQNSYLHGVLFKMIAEHTGYSIQEAKNKVKCEIGFYDEIKVKGEKVLIMKETSKLNKKDFGEFVDSVRIFAMERLDLNLPLPSDIEFDELYFLHSNNL